MLQYFNIDAIIVSRVLVVVVSVETAFTLPTDIMTQKKVLVLVNHPTRNDFLNEKSFSLGEFTSTSAFFWVIDIAATFRWRLVARALLFVSAVCRLAPKFLDEDPQYQYSASETRITKITETKLTQS